MNIMEYLESAGLAESTAHNYEENLELLELWLKVNKCDPLELSPGAILFFFRTMDWSNSTERSFLAAAKGYLKFTYGKQHPVVKMRHKWIDPGEQRTLEPEETALLLASIDICRPKGRRDIALLLLMLDTGLRSSEICRLRVADLDMDKCKLSVIQKGSRSRYAVFSEGTRIRLRRWFPDREQMALQGVETVFVSVGGIKKGQPLTRDGLRCVFRRMSNDAGLDLFSPHAMRRTYCTDAIRRNVNHKLIQTQGGWKTPAMVFRYAQAIEVEAYRGHFGDYADLVS